MSNPTTGPSEHAWELVAGGYDLQVHIAPDIIGRKYDDVALAEEFLSRGLAGFVLKSHYVPTAERAAVVRRAVPGIEAYGAVTLNHAVGGLNPVAVDVAGRSGARIVWFPTVDALNEADILTTTMPNPPLWVDIKRQMREEGLDTAPPITVLDDDGSVSQLARDCLRAAASYNMVVATGHLGRAEIFPLVAAAREADVDRIIVTHAEFPSEDFSLDEQVELADMGAVIEHCFTTAWSGKCTFDAMFKNVHAVGAERCIISTDLGQPANPDVATGFAMFAELMLEAGFRDEEVRQVTAEVPQRLVVP